MATTPATLNLRPQRRADYVLDVVFNDSAGTPINLTGWSAVAQVWDKDRTTQHGSFIVNFVDAAAGSVQLQLGWATTSALPDESFYDVLLINPSGLREFYLEGVIRPSNGYSSP
jgi:hypothetical protein